MDREQEELQFLGFFGILHESFKIIFNFRKIFSKITLSLILPLSFVFLAHIEITNILFSNILNTEDKLDQTREGTKTHDKLAHMISSEWLGFWLFKLAYFIFFLILALLSTSAVVYTVACIYTAKDITFRKVMSVVPKVWKRLMVTFIWNSIILFAYNLVAILVFITWFVILADTRAGFLFFLILSITYFMGIVYISVVWHLASVVSVLEDTYGIQAMAKSKDLIKGKMGISIAIFVLLNLSFLLIQFAFENLVVIGVGNMGSRVIYAVICFLLLFLFFLYGLVIQTVIYFVCKSYHHENIDKSSLADHLEVYLGEYAPLKGKDVQLEQFYV
ncbi:hypothetical protein RJ641_011116 [Dillenia turbinata]|uniref:Uncharacterized protein n=1 Tax=Dillenia turbinata TaxID=194707 RepID=A0AAN8V8Z6_9MAGN